MSRAARYRRSLGSSRKAFLLVSGSTFALFLAVGTIVPILPRYIAGPLGGSGADVGLGVGAFFVGSVLARPLAGRVGDARGRRVLMVGGGAGTAAAMAAFALAPNAAGLALARVIQGVGEAAFYVGAASAVTDLVPPRRRGEAVSYFSAALYGGLALGPLMGEMVFAHGRYGGVWLTAALLAAVGAACSLGVAHGRRPERAGAPSARLIHPAGLVPGAAFASGTFGYAAFNAFVPLYAPMIGVARPGLVFGGYASVTLTGRVLGARIPDRFGAAMVARAALCLGAIGATVLGLWRQPAGLWVGAVVLAAGSALMFPSLLSLALRAAPDAERGAVVGTLGSFFDIGQGAGALTLGPLVSVIGYSGGFLAGAVTTGAGLLLLGVARPRAADPAPNG